MVAVAVAFAVAVAVATAVGVNGAGAADFFWSAGVLASFFLCLLVPLPPHGLNALRCLRGRGCGACQRGARLKPASHQVAPLSPLAPATPRKWPSSKTVANCIRCLWCLCGGTRCRRRETSAGLEGRPGCDDKDLECAPGLVYREQATCGAHRVGALRMSWSLIRSNTRSLNVLGTLRDRGSTAPDCVLDVGLYL